MLSAAGVLGAGTGAALLRRRARAGGGERLERETLPAGPPAPVAPGPPDAAEPPGLGVDPAAAIEAARARLRAAAEPSAEEPPG